jgi:hypothetical protein
VKLLRKIGAEVVAACFVIDLPELGGAKKIEALGVPVRTLMSPSRGIEEIVRAHVGVGRLVDAARPLPGPPPLRRRGRLVRGLAVFARALVGAGRIFHLRLPRQRIVGDGEFGRLAGA